MTDDQQLIAEARTSAKWIRDVTSPMTDAATRAEFRMAARALDGLATALSTAAVRYRAEGWDACLEAIDQNELNTAQAREGNPYREGLEPNLLDTVKREAASAALIEVAEQVVLEFGLDPEDPLRGRLDATWNSAINAAAGGMRARAAELRVKS